MEHFGSSLDYYQLTSVINQFPEPKFFSLLTSNDVGLMLLALPITNMCGHPPLAFRFAVQVRRSKA